MSVRSCVALILVLSLVCRAADTQPATQPAVIDLKADLIIAQSDLVAAQSSASQDFDASPTGKPLVSDVAAKKAALEQARASGTPQERLDASAAFNRARKTLEDARAEALKASGEVVQARTKVAAAATALAKALTDEKARAAATQAAEEEKARNDPVRIAIQKHRVIKGMTDDQVKQAMHFTSDPAKATWVAERTINDPGDGRTISTWHIGYTSRYQREFAETRTVTVVEEGGVVVKVSQTIHSELLDHEPE